MRTGVRMRMLDRHRRQACGSAMRDLSVKNTNTLLDCARGHSRYRDNLSQRPSNHHRIHNAYPPLSYPLLFLGIPYTSCPVMWRVRVFSDTGLILTTFVLVLLPPCAYCNNRCFPPGEL